LPTTTEPGANYCVIANRNISDHDRTGAKLDAVPDGGGSTLAVPSQLVSYCYALPKHAAITDRRVFIDHYTK
jgi:hypothetical protein